MDDLTAGLQGVELDPSTPTVKNQNREIGSTNTRSYPVDASEMLRGLSREEPIDIEDGNSADNGAAQSTSTNEHGRERNLQRSSHIEDDNIGPSPSYYDPRFRLVMFRGPGYEDFPVALDSKPHFQEVVDEWEKKKTRIHRRKSIRAISLQKAPGQDTRAVAGFTDNVVPSSAIAEDLQEGDLDLLRTPWGVPYQDYEDACLAKAVEIFPDIDHDFVFEQCKVLLEDAKTGRITPNANPAGKLIERILERRGYPEQTRKRKRRTGAANDATGHIDWGQNANANLYPGYILEGTRLLAEDFVFIPTCVISEKLRETGRILATYRYLEACERNFDSVKAKPYRRLKKARTTLESKYVPKDAVNNRASKDYSRLVNEYQAARKACADEERKAKRKKAEEDAETRNLKFHAEAGLLIECQCCFDNEIPINRAVSCDGQSAHFYCNSCVKNLASAQIGQMKWQMNCIFSGVEPCNATLSKRRLHQILDAKAVEKLEELQCNEEIGSAALEGLEDCPFCEFKAICPSVEVDREFRCENPKCSKTSCRLCREETHIPKTCEEAKLSHGESLRHTVEEAMTDAILRRCPNRKCKMPIIKDFGCNKMVCTNCQSKMCYACGEDITSNAGGGYDHFNEPGSKCALNNEAQTLLDARRRLEVQQTTIHQLVEENPDIDENTLKVDDGPPPGPMAAVRPVFDDQPVDPRLGQYRGLHDLLREGEQVIPFNEGPGRQFRERLRPIQMELANAPADDPQNLERFPVLLGQADRAAQMFYNDGGRLRPAGNDGRGVAQALPAQDRQGGPHRLLQRLLRRRDQPQMPRERIHQGHRYHEIGVVPPPMIYGVDANLPPPRFPHEEVNQYEQVPAAPQHDAPRYPQNPLPGVFNQHDAAFGLQDIRFEPEEAFAEPEFVPAHRPGSAQQYRADAVVGRYPAQNQNLTVGDGAGYDRRPERPDTDTRAPALFRGAVLNAAMLAAPGPAAAPAPIGFGLNTAGIMGDPVMFPQVEMVNGAVQDNQFNDPFILGVDDWMAVHNGTPGLNNDNLIWW